MQCHEYIFTNLAYAKGVTLKSTAARNTVGIFSKFLLTLRALGHKEGYLGTKYI